MRRFLFVSVVLSSLACSGVMDQVKNMQGGEGTTAGEKKDGGDAAKPAENKDAGAKGGNAAACRAYVETLNGLPCMGSMPKQDAATMCPDALDQMPCDVSKYYKCMTDNSKCNGNIPDMSGISGCGTPTCQ